ncbi:MAG: cyclophilin-like fold protein [Chloroflexota bacterium]
MTKLITIKAGAVTTSATLNDSPTAEAIWNALPIEGSANIWGDEIYFSIPVSLGEEQDAQAEVQLGDLAFWPPGNAFCIFYGPTPASIENEPRAASPVNVFGQVEGDATIFRSVGNGAKVSIQAQ